MSQSPEGSNLLEFWQSKLDFRAHLSQSPEGSNLLESKAMGNDLLEKTLSQSPEGSNLLE